jgi:hypothetical protein
MSISDIIRMFIPDKEEKKPKQASSSCSSSQEAADKALKDLFSKNSPDRFHK